MTKLRELLHRVQLGYLLFAFLVVFGSLPLVINAVTTTLRNQGVLERQEKEKLAGNTELLRVSVMQNIEAMRRQLGQARAGLASIPTDDPAMTENWMQSFLRSFQKEAASQFDTRVVDLINGRAQRSPVRELQVAMDEALEGIRRGKESAYELISLGRDRDPVVLVSETVRLEPDGELAFVVQAMSPLSIRRWNLDDVFIIDLEDGGRVLWASSTDAEPVKRAMQQTEVVQGFLSAPRESDIIPVMAYDVRVGANFTPMIGQVTRLGDTGWAVVVQQPRSTAFMEVRKLFQASLVSAGIMVLFALVFAGVATRLITHPIQRLARTTQAIAKGKFGEKVEAAGFGAEITELADSFNTMSVQIADHVEQLRQAAAVNRDLFIGSIRAFLAAIEAKEPYTRGHSERVASFSQAIADQLHLPADHREQIWISGLLHDIGKIGIDDRVLKKGDVLTDEEYEEMKRHPVIGWEIMSPIEQLRDILPVIRWHHEDWDGSGYPDGLKGEEVPLEARIVAVADTFDAITTQRVYQDPYNDEEALGIISKLTGKRFDPRVAAAFVAAFRAGEIDTSHAGRRGVEPATLPPETAAIHT